MNGFTMVIEILGWTGVLLYVIAYYLVSAGRLGGRSKSYQNLNLIGAFGVAANAFYYGAYPSAVVNVIWFAIAAATLLGVLRVSGEADPGHPDSPEGRAMSKLLRFGGGLLAMFGISLAIIAIVPRPPRPLQPVLVFTQDWEPYVGRTLPGGGPLTELVREIFRAANLDAQIQFTEWTDALEKTETGIAAAAFPFIDHRDRAERVLFTDPLLTFDYVLFYRRGMTAPTGEVNEAALQAWLDKKAGDVADPSAVEAWRDTDWRLGAVEGYALWPALAAITSIDVYYPNPVEAFQALERGDVHFIAEGLLVGQATVQDPASGVDASRLLAAEPGDPRASSTEALRLVTGTDRTGQSLRQRLNDHIAELRRRGDLRRLQQQIDAIGRTEVSIMSVTDAVRASDPDGEVYRLAAGTRASVLAWPAGFHAGPVEPAHADHRALVKVLSGPLRGWEVLVEPASFAIVEPKGNP